MTRSFAIAAVMSASLLAFSSPSAAFAPIYVRPAHHSSATMGAADFLPSISLGVNVRPFFDFRRDEADGKEVRESRKKKKEKNLGKKGETAFERHRAAIKSALGIEDEAAKKPETAFDRHRAAARNAMEEISEKWAERRAGDQKRRAGDVEEGDSGAVDTGLLNRLLVHAEAILECHEGVAELLGGQPSASLLDRVLSSSSTPIVVEGSQQTEGLRAIVEVVGPKRSGTALLVGDRRGVLLLKVTVGGRTIDAKSMDGLDIEAANGMKKRLP